MEKKQALKIGRVLKCCVTFTLFLGIMTIQVFFFFATLIVVTEHEHYSSAVVKIGITTVSFHAINPDFRLSTAYVKIYSAIFKLQKL